jgi:hypothetical protein
MTGSPKFFEKSFVIVLAVSASDSAYTGEARNSKESI